MRQELHSGWTLQVASDNDVPSSVKKDVPATVPGCVHTDLLAADLIPEPYFGTNEKALQWIGENDWSYRTTFTVEKGLLESPHLDLVCEGLDTVATLELNGEIIGETENMHVGYRFDVKRYLESGENELVITFRSALAYGNEQVERLGYLPTSGYPHPYNFIRKMACNFGWDWGPTFITAGIWQPLYLEAWGSARIASVRPLVPSANEKEAVVEVHTEFAGKADGAELTLTLTDPAGKKVIERREEASESLYALSVSDPQLWWCVGHGEQPLYTLRLELTKNNQTLDTWQRKIGLREIRLDTSEDDIGTKFTLHLNGKPIFCKGANWIPDDCFVTRVTPERYRERVTQALDANMNMLRVWGGGIYEQKAFYDTCDELGILVWQDFLFACAQYPEEAPFDTLVKAEARYQVARLSPHPSLVLWNGCNENLWGYWDWSLKGKTWREWAQGRTWGAGFYFELLPGIVKELDPSRPYAPGSPYSNDPERYPNEDAHGTRHIWDVWNRVDYTVYRDYRPRFSGEFGLQGPPNYATLQAALPAAELAADSASLKQHQKAENGQDKLSSRLAEHFPEPESFDDWHYFTQLNQARAVALGVEWFRSLAPACMGALYWQINDCWPVISWAAVDGYGRKKPLWYATRKFFADKLVTIQPDGDELYLCLVNDSDEPFQDQQKVTRATFSGEVLAEQTIGYDLEPRSVQRIKLAANFTEPNDATTEFLVTDGFARAFWYFERDKHLEYPQPEFEVDLEPSPTGYTLTLTAKTFLRDTCVFVDKLDPSAEVSEQLVTLLPGESFTFEITTEAELRSVDLTKETALYTANRAATLASTSALGD